MVFEILYENKSIVVILMKELKKYLVRKKGTIEEKLVYALNQENAVKKFYVPSLKKLKSAFPYKSSGYVEEVDTGDYTPYTFKYNMGKAEVNFCMIKIGPIKRKLKAGWIPKELKKHIYLKDKDIDEPTFMSFPNMMVENNSLRIIMINPRTNQVLARMLVGPYSTHATYVEEKEKNPIEDFIIFDMFAYNKDKDNGFIKVVNKNLLDMKNQEKSRDIVKGLNMLILNGIDIKSNIYFYGMKEKCSIGYFLKSKVMW